MIRIDGFPPPLCVSAPLLRVYELGVANQTFHDSTLLSCSKLPEAILNKSRTLTNFNCSLELIGYRRCHEVIDGVSRRTVQINYGEIAVAYILIYLIYSIYHQEAERHHDANWYTFTEYKW